MQQAALQRKYKELLKHAEDGNSEGLEKVLRDMDKQYPVAKEAHDKLSKALKLVRVQWPVHTGNMIHCLTHDVSLT